MKSNETDRRTYFMDCIHSPDLSIAADLDNLFILSGQTDKGDNLRNF